MPVLKRKPARKPKPHVHPQHQIELSEAQLATSYVRSDDGWLMVEVSPGCFVGQKPKTPANDNVPRLMRAA